MEKYDLVGGLVWLVLGIGLCIESIKLKLGNIHNPGAGFLACLSGIGLGVLGLILIFTKISRSRKDEEGHREEETSEKRSWNNFISPLLALLILFGYVLLLEILGFVLTTFISLFLLFKLSEPKRWLKPLILSSCTVVLSYLVFSVLLQCRFPKGIFR